MTDKESPRLSRREFSGLAAAATVSMLCQDSQASSTGSQSAPAPPAVDEARIAGIEKSRGHPLTPDQRRKIGGTLKDQDETAAALRKFVIPDGAGEPMTTFVPLRRLRTLEKGA